MNRSLRSRLLRSIGAAIAASFAIGAVLFYGLMRASLLQEFDALLGSKARVLATLVEQRESDIEIEFAEHPMQEFARKIRPEYYEVWDEDGTVLSRSRRLAESDLEYASGSLAAPGYQLTTLPDGRPGRQAAIQFLPGIEGESLEYASTGAGDDSDDDETDRFDFSSRRRLTLVVARGTTEIDQTLAQLGWLLVGVSGMVILTALGVVAWLVKRNLSPLDQLAVQIAELDEHELAAQFHLKDVPSELEPVVAQLNELLFRIDEAFQRERDFSADVAHELRTPLSGLRCTLEVVLSQDREKEVYLQALKDCTQISVGTQRLVETLLSLTRIESGLSRGDRALVNLERLLADSWELHELQARRRKLNVSFEGPSGVVVCTDSDKLQIVFANLLSNAVEYANEGGLLQVRWHIEEKRLRLSFGNSGCLLTGSQTQKVFDRFWRADTSRAATGIHAGLGLSLCERIVGLLGGSIVAESLNGDFVVTLDLGTEFIVQPETRNRSNELLVEGNAMCDKETTSVREASTAP